MLSTSNTMAPVRVHVALAHAGIASRRKIEEWVKEGRVSINGRPATLGQKITASDLIKIDGKVVAWSVQEQELVYYLINKPAGHVSTTSDELGRPTVLKLVPKTKQRLYPVGRLDMDSEGLMLLTNDGELAYQFTHPKFEIKKTYQALVAGTPTAAAINFLRKGVKLYEGWVTADSVEVLRHEAKGTWIEMVIHEGRYHQVRRMLERAGYQTLRLIRTTMGPLTLEMVGEQPYIKLSGGDVRRLLKP